MAKYLIVMLGGAIGAVSRFIVATLVAQFYATLFPLGTLVINVSGSFLIGLLMTLFVNRVDLNLHWRLFLVTGILGGYTTFSSFEWEAYAVARGGAVLMALLYVLGSVVFGFGGVWLGAMLSNRLWTR